MEIEVHGATANDGAAAESRQWGRAPHHEPDHDGAAQLLRARARSLAEAPPQDDTGASVDVLVFRIGEEEYAFRSSQLRMVYRATNVTPVPCTPSFIAGMLNIRGDVVTVLDLSVVLGVHGHPSPADSSSIVLAECVGIRVGLLVHEVLGIRPLALAAMAPPLFGKPFSLGIAQARIVFLDLEQILLCGRFDVLEDVT